VLEESFRSASIPYVIARGTAFYDRKEVKDALAYLRLIANPLDEVALRRIINDPPRGIGKTTLQRVEAFAASRQLALLEAVCRAEEAPELSTRAIAALRKFAAMVAAWREPSAQPELGGGDRSQLADLVERVIRESGLEAHFRSSRSEEDQDRLANLGEIINAAEDFRAPVDELADEATEPPAMTVLDELSAYLESVALVSDADSVDPARGAVTLMTLHTAKGLEFDVVVVAGLEEGLLPHQRSIGDELQLEEERRLCFVGMTRARRHLLLTSAAVRTHRGLRQRTVASQFLGQLPESAVSRCDMSDQLDFTDPYDDEGYGGRRRGRRGDGVDLQVGCVVRHPTFGLGRIETIMPRPMGSAARVLFESGRVKTLILEYAKLERVEESH
jgi:DNA helicase-2/ATP-dependent DNA helicase PcrA